MSGTINTIAPFSGASSSFGASSSAPATDAATTSSAPALPVKNPQVIQDPVAGFITAYINTNNGQVVSQAPSAIAVAYLRQGLTADGMPKETPTTKPVAETV